MPVTCPSYVPENNKWFLAEPQAFARPPPHHHHDHHHHPAPTRTRILWQAHLPAKEFIAGGSKQRTFTYGAC